MEDIETRFNKKDRVHDNDDEDDSLDHLSVFSTSGKSFGKVTPRLLTTNEWEEIHFFVLNNCEEIQPFIK